jgi:hypothetical protein
MESFQALLEAGWGDRHPDPVTKGCPSCGAGGLVVVETDERELNLFCRSCDRCWSVEGDRMHRVDPVRCPVCSLRPHCFDRLRYEVPQWGTWSVEPVV